VRRPGPEFPLLSRLLSICDFEQRGDRAWRLEFLYRVVGVGTSLFAEMGAGGELQLLGPLGRSFSCETNVRKHLLVAGGIGIAPFPALQRDRNRHVNRALRPPDVAAPLSTGRRWRWLGCRRDGRRGGERWSSCSSCGAERS